MLYGVDILVGLCWFRLMSAFLRLWFLTCLKFSLISRACCYHFFRICSSLSRLSAVFSELSSYFLPSSTISAVASKVMWMIWLKAYLWI